MEGEEGGIFSETSDKKSLFLLKIKIKLKQSCTSKECNTIFKHIHQKTRAYLTSKNIRAKEDFDEQVKFVLNIVGGLWEWRIPSQILQFLPSFKLRQNCHINMNISLP